MTGRIIKNITYKHSEAFGNTNSHVIDMVQGAVILHLAQGSLIALVRITVNNLLFMGTSINVIEALLASSATIDG